MKYLYLIFLSLNVIKIYGQIIFTEHTIVSKFNFANCVFSSDLDLDDDQDMHGITWLDKSVRWWENDGNHNFIQHIITDDFYGAAYVYAIDINKDNHIDIVDAASEVVRHL